jgi:myosin VI
MEKENSKYREQIEQERRDHELALRLAQETHSQVEDISTPVRRQVPPPQISLSLSLYV